ncbi:uncharacterized protein LOC115441811 [Manduca sexta]|uniref:MADF domain-containing protein n=1 Tax=Manduca sexta TaxID=7130 RepID=A0A921YX84_MANSE|nr:uncharacterized protein LOC115441811 [Manduca sexta]KAG6447523.1 hypothetical protein O3G_MSEX005012 [Manduca sexta]
MDFIDIELLISLIESRPALWDITDECYKNKQSHFAAWMKICTALNDDFQALPDKEKNDFRKEVVKKWNNARDNWMKCHKRLINNASESKSYRKYKYYNQMSFLKKVVRIPRQSVESNSSTENEVDNPINEDNPQSDEDAPIKVVKKKDRKRKRQETNEQEEMVSLLNSIESDDKSRIMCFFKSIAPTVDRFNDDDIVEFQYEVIKVMRNISRRNQGSHYVYLSNS